MDLGSAPCSLVSKPGFAQRLAALTGEDWLDDAGDRVGATRRSSPPPTCCRDRRRSRSGEHRKFSHRTAPFPAVRIAAVPRWNLGQAIPRHRPAGNSASDHDGAAVLAGTNQDKSGDGRNAVWRRSRHKRREPPQPSARDGVAKISLPPGIKRASLRSALREVVGGASARPLEREWVNVGNPLSSCLGASTAVPASRGARLARILRRKRRLPRVVYNRR